MDPGLLGKVTTNTEGLESEISLSLISLFITIE